MTARMPSEPRDMLATAIETDGSFCEHSDELACSTCLADLAVRVVKDYLLDELADEDRFDDWYGAHSEELEDFDVDNPAAVVATYIADVVLPNRSRAVVDVELPSTVEASSEEPGGVSADITGVGEVGGRAVSPSGTARSTTPGGIDG